MAKEFLIAAVILAASAEISSAQDIAAGETQFKKCAPCHDVGEKAKNKIGPVVPVGNLRSEILVVQSAQNRHR